ncbi:hypothetical protein FQA39_LY11823 [Lamprigera yunnana]|nr:hypothetical protein FQA39_LY11823 [Lamprigera yunnana]
MPEQSNDYRVVVFGAGGVGKSSLVLRFVKGTFRESYIPTIEDTYRQVISCNKNICTLQITDTTGSHQFPAMQRLSISKGHAFILVYSVSSRQSLEELRPIWELIREIKGPDLTQIPVMLVGNKCDESAELREVSTSEGQSEASSWGVNFMETSAKTNHNVKQLFQELLNMEKTRNVSLQLGNKATGRVAKDKCDLIKMHFKYFVFISFLFAKFAFSSFVLWSTKEIEISPLHEFNNDDFVKLVTNYDVVALTSKVFNMAHKMNKFLSKKNAIFVPHSKVDVENFKELPVDLNEMEGVLNIVDSSNVIIVLFIYDENCISNSNLCQNFYEPTYGPILYKAWLPTDNTIEATIYSSKPPLLKVNLTKTKLGNAVITKMNVFNLFVQFIAVVPTKHGKISLKFDFYWRNEIWTINYVYLEIIDKDIKQYNLTLKEEDIKCYLFCAETAVFKDLKNNIELHLYDLHIQPDGYSQNSIVELNCLPFQIGPIWSQVLVALLLEVATLVGLILITNINQEDTDKGKNKQTATVLELL